MPPPPDHACAWYDESQKLQAQISEVQAKLAEVQHELEQTLRRFTGKKSEKSPRPRAPEDEQSRAERRRQAREASKAARHEAQLAKVRLKTERVVHPVPAEQRTCPECGRQHLKPVGEGRETVEYVLVPEHVIRRVHVQQTLSCSCGEYVVTAPPPDRVFDKAQYDAGLISYLVVGKCADSIPLYRLEKRFARLGLPLSRSTMNDLLHRSAELLRPIYARLLATIAAQDLVHADETSMRLLTREDGRNGFVWTFIAKKDGRTLVSYVFSPDRSGDTPERILGGTKGKLVVDAFTGYNEVTKVTGRRRGGCHAHVRRKFVEAQDTAPEAREAIEIIGELYGVEREARTDGIAGTPAHLELRRKKSTPIRERLHAWLMAERDRHPPKSPIGRAIRYALKNWDALGLFMADARVPLDNNIAESALRVVVLGRKNYLFVVNKESGENLAALYSLITTCEANGINPQAYLTDVLHRIQTHPQSRIDELLPHNWVPPVPPAPPPPLTPKPAPSIPDAPAKLRAAGAPEATTTSTLAREHSAEPAAADGPDAAPRKTGLGDTTLAAGTAAPRAARARAAQKRHPAQPAREQLAAQDARPAIAQRSRAGPR